MSELQRTDGSRKDSKLLSTLLELLLILVVCPYYIAFTCLHKTWFPHSRQDFLQCRALCDALPQCVAFVRRASDDVGYLGMSLSSLKRADDDPTKLLEVTTGKNMQSECVSKNERNPQKSTKSDVKWLYNLNKKQLALHFKHSLGRWALGGPPHSTRALLPEYRVIMAQQRSHPKKQKPPETQNFWIQATEGAKWCGRWRLLALGDWQIGQVQVDWKDSWPQLFPSDSPIWSYLTSFILIPKLSRFWSRMTSKGKYNYPFETLRGMAAFHYSSSPCWGRFLETSPSPGPPGPRLWAEDQLLPVFGERESDLWKKRLSMRISLPGFGASKWCLVPWMKKRWKDPFCSSFGHSEETPNWTEVGKQFGRESSESNSEGLRRWISLHSLLGIKWETAMAADMPKGWQCQLS